MTDDARPACPLTCAVCGKHLQYWGSGARIFTHEPESARRLLYHCPDHDSQDAVYEPATDRWVRGL